jgi:hypothetical protein
LALKIPHKFGEIPSPGKPDGTGRARPVRKISSLPEIGTLVVQVLELLSNEVVAQLALGLKTVTPLGTGEENALDVTVEPQKVIVAPLLGIPLALIWALNQMVSPAGIAVLLKFDWMHDCAHGRHGFGVGVGVGVGVGIGVGVDVGQLRLLGENLIGMVLKPSNVAEPEKLLVPVRGPSGCVIVVPKVLSLAVKGIELLMVIAVPDGGVTVIE